jgi:formylglycine-generating enzyme required for sulfatase activity
MKKTRTRDRHASPTVRLLPPFFLRGPRPIRSLLQQFSCPFQQLAIAMASVASRRRLHLLPPVRLAEAPDRIALHQPEVPGVAPALQAASTVQLAGGPLVTAYAYEDAFGQSRMATARWELPAATEPSSKSIQPAAPPASCRNSLGMSLVYCAPGEFLMGSPDNDATARPDEKPQVRVPLTPGFYLGRHEVTQAEWQAVMQTTPWKNQEREHEGARHAATFVSWDDAREFCRRLSEREGLRYRLPTEAEWEYACRAGTTTRFSFGDAAERLGEFGWWGRDVREGNVHEEPWTHEVGLKRANPWGFYDMHGNCWEWCDTPAGLPLAAANSALAQVAADARRSIRGGGWCHLPNECRSAYRPPATLPTADTSNWASACCWSCLASRFVPTDSDKRPSAV